MAAELGRIEPDPRGVSLHYLGDATIGQPGALNPLSLDDWSENRSCNRSGMVPNSARSILPGGGVALPRDLADIGTLDTRLCAHQGDACQHWCGNHRWIFGGTSALVGALSPAER